MVVSAFGAGAEVVKIQLPLETAAFKAAPGAQLANGQCLTCHSADYPAMQPPKGRDFWKAEVEKMRDKYGAPIPPEQVEALIGYLAKNYGTETSAAVTSNIVSSVLHTEGGAVEAPELARRSGCLGCHNVEVKIVGPAYKDVAAKYRGKAEGLDRVEHQITHGGSGQWGQIPMPPFTQFTPEEVEALAKWVLSQK